MKRLPAMTVGALIQRLSIAVASGKVDENAWVVLEGCDCNGYLVGADEVADEKYVPRTPEYDEDGMFVTEHVAPGPTIKLNRMDRP